MNVFGCSHGFEIDVKDNMDFLLDEILDDL